MTGPEKNQGSSPEEKTVLHLNKFVTRDETPPTEEGVTLLIRKAACETVKQSVDPVVVPERAGPLTPEELLGAVAYCYAKGIYSSGDIERKMLEDEAFREALGGVVPDPQTIRRFRRLNRQAIQQVLEKFFARRRLAKPPSGAQLPSDSSWSVIEKKPSGEAPAKAGESTTAFVKRKATDELDKASFIDGMSQE